MNLKEEIRKLADLQTVDTEIYNLKQSRDVEKPQMLEKLEKSFEEKKSALSSYDQEVKDLTIQKKDKELELASQEENIRKAQAQLYQLKTNKEYQAKLTEIESFKANISVYEESILSIMEELEQAEKNLAEAKAKLAEEEKVYNEETKKIKDEVNEINLKLKTMEDKRSISVKDVDSSILEKYDRLLNARAGIALSTVENEHCQSCHMRVTAQKINEIKMYKELVLCETCARFLYLKEDFE